MSGDASPVPVRERAIGVFDSGVGGLTVLRALVEALPQEQFLYLGDTARLPYGTKSAETVVRYALRAADELVERGIKCLVVACNTASAAALGAMRQRFEDIPVIGVIEPGARAAVAASRTGRIAVIATEGTVRGGAYTQAIARLRPDAVVTAMACQLFVALAEEGWTEGPVAERAAERYLAALRGAAGAGPDTLVLGCTHFPLLQGVIERALGGQVRIVDSAATTAQATRALLAQQDLLRTSSLQAAPQLRYLATDGAERFAQVGSRFMGRAIAADEVELVDL
ncbi:MAG TPA: glutamate racemase [Steroidobacteraceae bacterium]|nr:glutamate racemase [Steroidobacteraceae bacterium]